MIHYVWKYTVRSNECVQYFRAPPGSRPIALDYQHGQLRMWTEGPDMGVPPHRRERMPYAIISTGWNIPPGFVHVATCLTPPSIPEPDSRVWHLYRKGP